MNIGSRTGPRDGFDDSLGALALRGGHAFFGCCLPMLVIGLALLLGVEISASSTYAAETEGCGDGDAAGAKPKPGATMDAALRDNFLVLPIRTDLQRATGSKYDKAKVLVLVNAAKVIKGEDEALDAKALRLQRIWEAIEPFTEGEPGNVVFRVWCGWYVRRSNDDGTWPASSILIPALQQFGRDVGFQDVAVNLYFLPPGNKYVGHWERAVADFAARPGEDDVEEAAVGDQQIKLYPVRSPLSRLLYGGADCVVHIVPPIDEVDVAAAIETMKISLPQLDLKKKDKVVFHYRWKNNDIADAISDEVTGRHVYREMLGFKEASQMARN